MKKNRFREADPIVEENNINEAPTQASPQEVVDAQANVDAPTEGAVDSTLADDTASEPVMDTPQEDLEVPEGSMDVSGAEMGGDLGGGAGGMSASGSTPEFGEGVKVNPETVSMEIQVPTEQLASAVAQATGDVVPAETAPDIEMAKEEELVAQQNEPTEQAPEMGAESPSPLEAEAPMGEESTEQSVPVESLDNDTQQTQTMGESKKKMSPSKKVDIKFKKKLDGIIKKGVENMAKSLNESEEDDFEDDMPAGLEIDGDSVYFEGGYVGFISNPVNCIYVSIEKCDEAEDYFLSKDWIVKTKYDFGKPFYESEEAMNMETAEEFDSDADTPDSEGLPEGYANESGRDEALENTFQDVSDEDVSEFMGRLQGYLDNEETTPQEVSDALRTSADFMDMVGGETPSNTPLMDTIRDTEDFDFDSLVDGEYENAESRDYTEDTEVPEEDDDDFEEALVRKPCRFPKDKTAIKEAKDRRANRLKETQITDSYDLLSGRYQPWSGAIDTWENLERLGLLEELDSLLEDIYPEGLDEGYLNDILWHDREWVYESLGLSKDGEPQEEEEDYDEDSEFIGDEEDYEEDDFEESRNLRNKRRIKESRRPVRRLKEGPGAGYTLEIEDLEILDDTVEIVDYDTKDNSWTFTVEVTDGTYTFSADHSYWGGSDEAYISNGILTGVYYSEDTSPSFIGDTTEDTSLKDTFAPEIVEDIKSCLPYTVTVSAVVGRGWQHYEIGSDFSLEGRYNGIAKLKEPYSYYFDFISFEGHSEDLGSSIERMWNSETDYGYDYDESLRRNRRKIAESAKDSKLKEASEIIYPAGSGPSESSALYKKSTRKDSNLVKAHEKVVRSRREALKNFHESVNRPTPVRNRRFNEALRSPLSYGSMSTGNLSGSAWKNNKFIDKYEESQKLDFNTLLNEGYLG